MGPGLKAEKSISRPAIAVTVLQWLGAVSPTLLLVIVDLVVLPDQTTPPGGRLPDDSSLDPGLIMLATSTLSVIALLLSLIPDLRSRFRRRRNSLIRLGVWTFLMLCQLASWPGVFPHDQW